MNNEGFISS